MKFTVGYQNIPDDTLIRKIIEYKERISEVYLSFGDFASGRGKASRSDSLSVYEATEKQCVDLDALSEAGLSFNLLFNGNCYGKDSLSRAFFNKVGETADYVEQRFGLRSVTVTSPIVAKFFKVNFPHLEVRASVNMEIGTTEGMDYIADVFDGYYMKREYNRDFSRIRLLKSWCDANGKKLYALANSGCLNYCSVHNFHDNVVAHEDEILQMDNAYDFHGKCHEYLSDTKKQRYMIRNTNFIRPEDVPLYEGYFEAMKLATRVSASPVRILTAYMNGRYFGGINDLLEPNHGYLIAPSFLDNGKFPKDFAETVGNCSKDCEHCTYCTDVFEAVRTTLTGGNTYVDEPDDQGSGACGGSR